MRNNKKSKLAIPASTCIIVIGLITLCISGVKALGISADITNKDGVAYINYMGTTSELINEKGEPISYSEGVSHKINIDSFNIGKLDNELFTTIQDLDTGVVYAVFKGTITPLNFERNE